MNLYNKYFLSHTPDNKMCSERENETCVGAKITPQYINPLAP